MIYFPYIYIWEVDSTNFFQRPVFFNQSLCASVFHPVVQFRSETDILLHLVHLQSKGAVKVTPLVKGSIELNVTFTPDLTFVHYTYQMQLFPRNEIFQISHFTTRMTY